MTMSAVGKRLLQDLLEHTRLELMETADMSGKAVDCLMTCVPTATAASYTHLAHRFERDTPVIASSGYGRR
jgi:hypothetical protein